MKVSIVVVHEVVKWLTVCGMDRSRRSRVRLECTFDAVYNLNVLGCGLRSTLEYYNEKACFAVYLESGVPEGFLDLGKKRLGNVLWGKGDQEKMGLIVPGYMAIAYGLKVCGGREWKARGPGTP